MIPKSVTTIEDKAFIFDDKLEKIYYMGDVTEFSQIQIKGSDNINFEAANKYYYSEEKPAYVGPYWHYDANGKPVEWPIEN